MASAVTLDLDGKSFDVLKCLCKCEQKFDQHGGPAPWSLRSLLETAWRGIAGHRACADRSCSPSLP